MMSIKLIFMMSWSLLSKTNRQKILNKKLNQHPRGKMLKIDRKIKRRREKDKEKDS